MVLGKLTSKKLESTTTTLTSDSYTNDNFQQILFTSFMSNTGSDYERVRFSGNSETVYRNRGFRQNGASGTSDTTFIPTNMSDFQNTFCVMYACSIAGKAKLLIANEVDFDTVSTGTAPNLHELGGVFAPSPDTGITSIDVDSANGNKSYASGSNIMVSGSEIDQYVVQDGAIFYETDTNKSYVLYNGSWTEL